MPVQVVGTERVILPDRFEDVEAPVETVEHDIHCHTGRVIDGPWTGVPVAALVTDAGMPPETTHVVVEAADGHTVSIPVETALDAVVAYRRDGDPIVVDGNGTGAGDGGENGVPTVRIVGPGISSTRSIRDVRRIEAAAFGPGEDPGAVEYHRKVEEDL